MLAFLLCLWLATCVFVVLAPLAFPAVSLATLEGTAEERCASDAIVALRTARALNVMAQSVELQIAFAARYGRRDPFVAEQGAIRARALRHQATLLLAGVVS